ncbi:unnamed protein product [Linum tenue]|uniref:VQ domain-containing protein n=1 Tax=Linum tenue TaxID=586396 RepID=A0AAV0R1F4_9ROSI|nr:unnamed protein product [Linum tenue]
MRNKRPSQPQSSSSSSISPSKPKNNNNKSNLINKKKTKKKKEENLLRLQQQQQLNRDGDHRPILRPKVYITDISNFKTLVQELTGNGAPVAAQREPSPSSERETYYYPEFKRSDSLETVTSVDGSSVESSGTPSFNHEETNGFQPYGYYDQMGLYSLEEDNTTSDGMLACQADLEALLADMDQHQFPLVFDANYSSSESHHQIHHQQQEADLSIYDYDFSGIVC